jgi:tRNA(fMet)-specific endonuclease VapC
MLRYLIDTEVAVAFLRQQSEFNRSRFAAYDGSLAISTVSLFELMYGSEKSDAPASNRQAVQNLLGFIKVIDFDAAAAEHSGQIRAVLAVEGRPIGKYDLLIAGLARSRGLAVVTGNVREFERVPGLLVENWLTPT